MLYTVTIKDILEKRKATEAKLEEEAREKEEAEKNEETEGDQAAAEEEERGRIMFRSGSSRSLTMRRKMGGKADKGQKE